MSLDSFLNVVIPLGVIIFFIGIIYVKLKEPIHSFFHWIAGLISAGKERIPEPRYSEIIYE
jgi:hypothetical protein